MQKKELIGVSAQEMEAVVASLGEPRFRAGQLFHALYHERQLDLQRITTLPLRLRKRLEMDFQATLPAIEKKFTSTDGTSRYLLRLADGIEIETVLMPEPDRDTICISTQAGCAVDCKFCLTGVLGFQRNLGAGEIVGQVLLLIRENRLRAKKRDEEQAETRRLNLVFMGMGEPLLNYENTLEAVRLLSDPEGMGLSLAHMTLSTSGVVPGIKKLGAELVRPKLAVSLSATTDEQRSRIMPINRKWPIAELLKACKEFPLGNRERLTFEYVLLDGLNDTLEDAARLARLIRPLHAKVNLIGLNPGSELPFSTPPQERVLSFQKVLIDQDVAAFIRKPRGQDIFAACGQLKLAGAGADADAIA